MHYIDAFGKDYPKDAPVSIFGGFGYDSVYVLAEALQRARAATAEKLRDALEHVPTPASRAVPHLGRDHNGLSTFSTVLTQIEKQKFKLMKRASAARWCSGAAPGSSEGQVRGGEVVVLEAEQAADRLRLLDLDLPGTTGRNRRLPSYTNPTISLYLIVSKGSAPRPSALSPIRPSGSRLRCGSSPSADSLNIRSHEIA